MQAIARQSWRCGRCALPAAAAASSAPLAQARGCCVSRRPCNLLTSAAVTYPASRSSGESACQARLATRLLVPSLRLRNARKPHLPARATHRPQLCPQGERRCCCGGHCRSPTPAHAASGGQQRGAGGCHVHSHRHHHDKGGRRDAAPARPALSPPSQKVFRRAVDRNLMRRRMRHVYRTHKELWPPRVDIVVVMGPTGATQSWHCNGHDLTPCVQHWRLLSLSLRRTWWPGRRR